jgi:plastocyanin
MKRTYPLLAILLGAGLLLAACTGAAPTPTRAPAAAPAPTANAAAAATPAPLGAPAVRESDIRGLNLESFTIAVGTKVIWTNRDEAQHTTTAGIPGRIDDLWDSDILDRGRQFAFTFTQTGTFPYWCRIHPQMTGVVTVR